MSAVRMLALAAAVTLSGCTVTIPLGDRPTVHVSGPEVTYQTLNAIDFAETVNVARRPDCFSEAGTPAADILGRHPSPRAVEAYGAAQGLLHWAISGWLDRRAEDTGARSWRAALWTWNVLTIANSANAVVSNWRIGTRPFGAGCVR